MVSGPVLIRFLFHYMRTAGPTRPHAALAKGPGGLGMVWVRLVRPQKGHKAVPESGLPGPLCTASCRPHALDLQLDLTLRLDMSAA